MLLIVAPWTPRALAAAKTPVPERNNAPAIGAILPPDGDGVKAFLGSSTSTWSAGGAAATARVLARSHCIDHVRASLSSCAARRSGMNSGRFMPWAKIVAAEAATISTSTGASRRGHRCSRSRCPSPLRFSPTRTSASSASSRRRRPGGIDAGRSYRFMRLASWLVFMRGFAMLLMTVAVNLHDALDPKHARGETGT
jgi:hypothetical protein